MAGEITSDPEPVTGGCINPSVKPSDTSDSTVSPRRRVDDAVPPGSLSRCACPTMDLSRLDELEHPSFDYSWSPQKNEGALSPEATHSAWCSSLSFSPLRLSDTWQDEFAKQESALLARSKREPSSVPAEPLPVVRSVSDSAANCAANCAANREGACGEVLTFRKGLSPEPPRKPAAPGAGGAQMMDKRRCRLLHAPSFRPAIDAYRSQQLATPAAAAAAAAATAATAASSAAAATAATSAASAAEADFSTEGGGARVDVFVRKRPMLPHEEARGG